MTLLERFGLLAAQSHHRIYACCTPRGNARRSPPAHRQEQRHRRHRPRIVRLHSIKQRAEDTARGIREQQSNRKAGHTLQFLADLSLYLYRTAARLNCIPLRVRFDTMAFDEGSSEALETEKSSRNILRFVWILFVGIVLLLAVALMYVDFR